MEFWVEASKVVGATRQCMPMHVRRVPGSRIDVSSANFFSGDTVKTRNMVSEICPIPI
jgi:hypothetical protein